MTSTEQYQMIFKRKSIRKFRMEPLNKTQTEQLLKRLDQTEPLVSDIKTEIRLLPGNAVKGLLSIKAPHYLLMFSEKKELYLENAGFILQQIDLALTSGGIGACWLGAAKPTSEFTDVSSLPYVVSLAIGMPDEPLHRTEVAQFKRKKAEEICSTAFHAGLIEAARLAPSATNSQPWRFVTEEKAIHVYRMKQGVLKAWIYERMNRIDMGITLFHLRIAAEAKGFRASFTSYQDVAAKSPSGTTYTGTVELEEAHKFCHSKKSMLDDEWRRKNLPPDETLTALNLQPEDHAADIGCGIGYFTLPMAKMAGAGQTVIALDTSETMLQDVRSAAEDLGLSNVTTVRTEEYDLKIDDASVTYVLMANVLHEVADRLRFLEEARRILSPNGRIALLDFEKDDSIPGPPMQHRVSREEAIKLLTKTGFDIQSEGDFAGRFYGIVAVKKVSV